MLNPVNPVNPVYLIIFRLCFPVNRLVSRLSLPPGRARGWDPARTPTDLPRTAPRCRRFRKPPAPLCRRHYAPPRPDDIVLSAGSCRYLPHSALPMTKALTCIKAGGHGSAHGYVITATTIMRAPPWEPQPEKPHDPPVPCAVTGSSRNSNTIPIRPRVNCAN